MDKRQLMWVGLIVSTKMLKISTEHVTMKSDALIHNPSKHLCFKTNCSMKRNRPLNWVMMKRESFRLLFSSTGNVGGRSRSSTFHPLYLIAGMKTELTCCFALWLSFKHDSQQKKIYIYFWTCPGFNKYTESVAFILHDLPRSFKHWRWRFLCITKPQWSHNTICMSVDMWPSLMTTTPGNNKDTSVLHDNTRPRHIDLMSHHMPPPISHHTHFCC